MTNGSDHVPADSVVSYSNDGYYKHFCEELQNENSKLKDQINLVQGELNTLEISAEKAKSDKV